MELTFCTHTVCIGKLVFSVLFVLYCLHVRNVHYKLQLELQYLSFGNNQNIIAKSSITPSFLHELLLWNTRQVTNHVWILPSFWVVYCFEQVMYTLMFVLRLCYIKNIAFLVKLGYCNNIHFLEDIISWFSFVFKCDWLLFCDVIRHS